MEDLTLRSISRQDLSFIAPLHKLKSLDIKLGGIPDLSAISKLPNIEYIELWFYQGENGNNYEPRNFVPALNLKSLKLVSYGFGTVEKNKQFKEIVQKYNIKTV